MKDYSDIIDHPHHVSRTHPQMSMHDRAAQFSPFAALTGFDAAVAEEARVTDKRMELEEDERQRLNGATSVPFRAYRRAAGSQYHIFRA